jgi:hypothetical protein
MRQNRRRCALARLVMLVAQVEFARAAGARRERLRPTVHGRLDRRASALVGERLVVKAWDDVQVRVVEGSARLAEAVPDEHVAVWCESLVKGRLGLEQECVRRCPLLGCELERREAMCFREEHTTAGQDVRRVARVAR